MVFKWSTDIETGVVEIDEQHKELFSRLNGLLDACEQRKGQEEIWRFLSFLETYVVEHFNAEEERMKKYAFPGLGTHQQEHEEFKQKVAALKQSVREHGPRIDVLLKTVRASGDWLTNHIRQTDRAMAGFLRSKGAV